MRIIALDAATSTGWCNGVPGEKTTHGTFVIPPTMRHGGRFAYAFINWLDAMLAPYDADDVEVVFEETILPKETDIFMLRKLYGLSMAVQYVCHARGVKCRPVPMGVWRSTMLGQYYPVRRAGMKKGEMRQLFKAAAMTVAGILKYDPQTDDEAEACLLWEHEAALANPRYGAARAMAPMQSFKPSKRRAA